MTDITMIDDSFARMIGNDVVQGQNHIAELVRQLFEDHYEGADSAMHADAALFDDPLLLACLSAGTISPHIGEIIFGYLPDEYKPSQMDVTTDGTGTVYLPRLGYFSTNMPHCRLRMERSAETGDYTFHDGEQRVEASFVPVQTVAGGRIEVLRDNHPLCHRFFARPGEAPEQVEVRDITSRQIDNLDAAFRLIARVHPHYYSSLMAATRRIVVFHSGTLNSFADISVHGMAFLNAADWDDDVFFIEDIAHQCGHLVFGALTFDKERFLSVPPETPLQFYTGEDVEDRSVYDAFHGVFTEAFMYQCMYECYRQGLADGRRRHELLGRIAFIVRRFGSDLSILSRYPLFTPEGENILGNLLAIFKSAYESCWPIIKDLDLSNQGYNFSYRKFLENHGENDVELLSQ